MTDVAPSESEDALVVAAFNDAINARDLDRLARLMTATHRFVDTEGGTVVGREVCVAAWRGFFESFPDYRNVFTAVEDRGGGEVVARGRSVCTVPELDGPAVWLATVVGGRVDRWQVAEVAGGVRS